jgi:hypothetical protein
MKKPLNKISILLWVAAVLVATINIAQIYFSVEGLQALYREASETHLAVRTFLAALDGTITPVAILIGLGALIEIADQIRSNSQAK